MSTIKLVAGGVSSYTSAGFTASDFDSLANGSFVVASSGIDNTTNLDLWAEVSGEMQVGGTTTSTSYLGLWLLPRNRDGSTYGDGTPNGANLPGSHYWVANAGVRIGITAGNAVYFTFPRVLLPRGFWKWGISNHTGAALDSTAAASVEFWTTNLQSV